jgi:hypothetical protein
MTTLAIELNDASIAVARSDGLLVTEPGCAFESDEGIAFGEAALRSSRLRPRNTNDCYWAELGVDALAQPFARAKSAADLAHAQLLELWNRFGEQSDEVLLVVPGSFQREKLSLLLGITDACEMPVGGLVDAAVAACDRPYPQWDSVHVEAHLHEIGLTRIGLAQRGEGVVAEAFETVSQSGVTQLRERWARRISAAFIAQTRFDPLSDGNNEQRLFDALPGWLEAIDSLPAATLEFEAGETTRRIQISRNTIVAEAEDVYDRLAQRVAAARRPGRGLAVRAGAVLAGLPGATERLGQIAGVRVVALPEGAGALGALACASDVRSSRGRTSLVKSLSWRAPAGDLRPLRPDELEGAVPEATHLLIRHAAHLIREEGLSLHLGEAGQFHVIEEGGDDRANFAIRRSENGLRLEHAGELRLLVNAKPAESGVALASGDRITVAGFSEEARLITVNDDGP